MTVKELKKIIADLPDDMEVDGIGEYDELLPLMDANLRSLWVDTFERVTVLALNIEDRWSAIKKSQGD